MTSTNDGKEVKSNQTSGQKGKKYYIDLYNSLETRLSSECELRERTGHLCEAWRRIHSICRHALAASHPLLLGWLERHTAAIVLQTEWQSPNSKDEQSTFSEVLESVIRDISTAVADRHGSWQPWEAQLRQRAEWFRGSLANPWTHPVLSVLLDPRGKPPTDDEVLEWLKSERDIVFLTRLRQLVASKCDDLATALATALMDRVRAANTVVPDVEQAEEPKDKPKSESNERTFEGILRAEAGFTDESWALLTDIEFVLLHKGDRRSRCIELAKRTPLRVGYELVQRLQKRLENAKTSRDKRLWKSANEVATLIAQVVIARCMVVPACAGAARSALYCCARALAALVGAPALRRATAALAAPAATAAHLYWLARAVNTHTQKTEEMKPFVCELYVRAITSGMNELEKLKLDPEKEPEARSTEQTLASWFIELGSLFAASSRFKCECILTAFSVHPSPAMYERIKMAPILPPIALDVQEPREETNSEFGSWANDSRTQTNFVKTSETLNMKLAQHQANVLSSAILAEGESLGLGVDVCQDITVLLSGPRVKTLSWDMDRERLLENCRTYIERTHGGTRAVTTELKYLNLNPDDFQHLPEEEDDETDIYYGIEKGYEHLVEFQEAQPEAIWEDPLWYEDSTESACSTPYDSDHNPTSRQKKTKGHSYSSGEDSDPLSLVAEAKKGKKKDRPHSKERRKSNKDGSRSKKKEKKERKLKEKAVYLSECKSGALSGLIGIKVARVPMIVQDVKNERRDVNSTCVTDSDYDSQGKSSIASEGPEPDIVYEGQFSMDGLKSPETPEEVPRANNCRGLTISHCSNGINQLSQPKKQNTKPKKCRKNVNKSLPSETEPIDNNYGLSNPTVDIATNKATLPQKPIDKPKPSDKNVVKKTSEPSTCANDANKELKRKIAKLMQFRRQKALTNVTPKQESAIKQELVPKQVLEPNIIKTEMSSLIGSKIIKPTEIPKVTKQHADQLGVLTNEMNNLLSNPGITFKPPVVKHQYEKLKDTCSRALPIKYHCNKKTPPINKAIKVFQNTPQSKPATEINDNGERISHALQCTTAPERPAFDKHQHSFQEFLKELQGTINAGVYTHPKQTSGFANAKKEIKTFTDVTPVIPNITKAEPTISPQCAKPVVQPKRVENVPNTFSRLSYMHKNKQIETKPTTDPMMTPEIQNRVLLQNSIHAELDQRIADMKLKYLHNISISRVDNAASKLVPKDSPRVEVQKIGMAPQLSLVADNPVLSNMLQGSPANLLLKTPNARTESHKNNDNLEQSKTVLMSMPAKSQNTSLSERDQQDLLVLLRQQYKLNARAPLTPAKADPNTSKLINNLRVSNISVTSNTGSSTYAPVLTTNADVKNRQLNVPTNTLTSHQCFDINSPAADRRMLNNPTDLIQCKLNLNQLNNNVKIPTKLIQNKEKNKQQFKPKAYKAAINCPKDRSSELNIMKKTATNINKEISRDMANKKSSTLNQDWASVLDAIRAHKTPSRGPSALDLVKKDSYEKYTNSLRNQRIVRTNTAGEPNKVIKAISSSTQCNVGIIPQPPPKSPSAPNSKPPIVKPVQDVAKRQQSQNELIKKPNQNDFHKRASTENPETFTCELQKDDDPFISGIPNSDYEIIGELMDDDLRKEIGELSDDELYGLPAVSKVSKNNSNAKSKSETLKKSIDNFPTTVKSPIIVDPRSVLHNQKNRASNKLTAEQPIRKNSTTIRNVDTKIVKSSSAIPTNVSNLKPQIVSHEKIVKQPKNTMLAPIQNAIKHLPKNIVVSHTKSESKPAFNVNNNIVTNNQVQPKLDSPKVFITALPQPAVQNVVVFDAYSTIPQLQRSQVQSALSNVNHNSYVTMNSTPNLTVFKISQHAPAASPVIITATITLPVTTNTVPTATFASHFNTVQSIESAEAQGIKTSTVATVVSDQSSLTKSSNTLPNQPEAVVLSVVSKVSDESKLISDSFRIYNSNPSTESKELLEFNPHKYINRKVSSVVQKQDTMVPEKIDSSKSRSHRHSFENDVKKDNFKGQERLIKKRLALINRDIYHHCGYPPIPLTYSPLRIPVVTVDCKGENLLTSNNDTKNLSNVEAKLDVIDSNYNKALENQSVITDTRTKSNSSANIKKILHPDIKDSQVVQNTVQELIPASTKEKKKSASQCRRRSSNNLKGKPVKSKAKSTGRKTKVRLKVAVAVSKEEETKNNMVIDKDFNSVKVNDLLEKVDIHTIEIVDIKKRKKLNEHATKGETIAPSRASKRIRERNVKRVDVQQPITEVTAIKNTGEQFAVNVDNAFFDIEDALVGAKIEKAIILREINDKANCNLLPESETIQDLKENVSSNRSDNVCNDLVNKDIALPNITHGICKDSVNAKIITSFEISQPTKVTKDKLSETQESVDTELIQDVQKGNDRDNVAYKPTYLVAELNKSQSAVTELSNKVLSVQNEIRPLVGSEMTKDLQSVQEVLYSSRSTANDLQETYQPTKSPVVEAFNDKCSDICPSPKDKKTEVSAEKNGNIMVLTHKPKLTKLDDNIAAAKNNDTNTDTNKQHGTKSCVITDSRLRSGSVIKSAANISKNKRKSKQCLENNFKANLEYNTELRINHTSTEQGIHSPVLDSDLLNDKDKRVDEVISVESDSESINSEVNNAAEKSKKESNINKEKEDANGKMENLEIPQSYKNSIQFEELPLPDANNSFKRCVRIRLPTGKTFKATVSGAVPVNIDSLFADSTLRNILLSGFTDKKLYTLCIKQFSTPTNKLLIDTHVREVNVLNKILQSNVDTVNLISDDEDENDVQDFTTEFGKYPVRDLDKDEFTLHQNKFSQKCLVKLNRCPLPVKDTMIIVDESSSVGETTTGETLQDHSTVYTETPFKACENTKDNVLQNLVDAIFTDSMKNIAQKENLSEHESKVDNVPCVPDIIEIDDSSNDSVTLPDILSKPQPVKMHELKNLLLKDFGVDDIINDSSAEKERDKPDIQSQSPRTIQENARTKTISYNGFVVDDKECEESSQANEDQLKVILRKCYVKLVRCDKHLKQNSIDENQTNSVSETNIIKDSDIEDNILDRDAPQPGLCRSESFSILNEFALDDDIIVPILESDSSNRNSPVIEVFETIASLQNIPKYERTLSVMEAFDVIASIRNSYVDHTIIEKIKESGSPVNVTESIKCHSDWFTTKRSIHHDTLEANLNQPEHFDVQEVSENAVNNKVITTLHEKIYKEPDLPLAVTDICYSDWCLTKRNLHYHCQITVEPEDIVQGIKNIVTNNYILTDNESKHDVLPSPRLVWSLSKIMWKYFENNSIVNEMRYIHDMTRNFVKKSSIPLKRKICDENNLMNNRLHSTIISDVHCKKSRVSCISEPENYISGVSNELVKNVVSSEHAQADQERYEGAIVDLLEHEVTTYSKCERDSLVTTKENYFKSKQFDFIQQNDNLNKNFICSEYSQKNLASHIDSTLMSQVNHNQNEVLDHRSTKNKNIVKGSTENENGVKKSMSPKLRVQDDDLNLEKNIRPSNDFDVDVNVSIQLNHIECYEPIINGKMINEDISDDLAENVANDKIESENKYLDNESNFIQFHSNVNENEEMRNKYPETTQECNNTERFEGLVVAANNVILNISSEGRPNLNSFERIKTENISNEGHKVLNKSENLELEEDMKDSLSKSRETQNISNNIDKTLEVKEYYDINEKIAIPMETLSSGDRNENYETEGNVTYFFSESHKNQTCITDNTDKLSSSKTTNLDVALNNSTVISYADGITSLENENLKNMSIESEDHEIVSKNDIELVYEVKLSVVKEDHNCDETMVSKVEEKIIIGESATTDKKLTMEDKNKIIEDEDILNRSLQSCTMAVITDTNSTLIKIKDTVNCSVEDSPNFNTVEREKNEILKCEDHAIPSNSDMDDIMTSVVQGSDEEEQGTAMINTKLAEGDTIVINQSKYHEILNNRDKDDAIISEVQSKNQIRERTAKTNVLSAEEDRIGIIQCENHEILHNSDINVVMTSQVQERSEIKDCTPRANAESAKKDRIVIMRCEDHEILNNSNIDNAMTSERQVRNEIKEDIAIANTESEKDRLIIIQCEDHVILHNSDIDNAVTSKVQVRNEIKDHTAMANAKSTEDYRIANINLEENSNRSVKKSLKYHDVVKNIVNQTTLKLQENKQFENRAKCATAYEVLSTNDRISLVKADKKSGNQNVAVNKNSGESYNLQEFAVKNNLSDLAQNISSKDQNDTIGSESSLVIPEVNNEVEIMTVDSDDDNSYICDTESFVEAVDEILVDSIEAVSDNILSTDKLNEEAVDEVLLEPNEIELDNTVNKKTNEGVSIDIASDLKNDNITILKTIVANDRFEVVKASHDYSTKTSNEEIAGKVTKKNMSLVYKDDFGVILKGIEYEDPEIGICYVFPLTKSPEFSTESDILNTSSDSVTKVISEIEDENVGGSNVSTDSYNMDVKVIIPKVTYSKRNLKRKANFTDVHVNEKKTRTVKGKVKAVTKEVKRYKKAKNIDYPRLSIAALNDSSYYKEYKCLVNYYSSVKFSYSISFDKEHIDVPVLIKNWPITGPITKESEDEVEFDDTLFVDTYDVTRPKSDPIQQTLAEEINAEYNETDYPSSEIAETNFGVGFGERSDRVIKNLVDGGALKFSAATLSDVKQSQPFLLSKDNGDCENELNINHIIEDQKECVRRYITYIRVKDKVRMFFKKTTVELNRNSVTENTKDKTLYNDKTNNLDFPFDLYIPKSIAPLPIEAVAQVVQVGQLPVSAAAQNPVTCDPRVTQVSDASPSQCSAENSPQDESQQEIKTEYTELTTADLTLPLVHDYAQHNQAVTVESQANMNLSVTNENIPIETDVIKSEIKIELVEETPEEKDEFNKSQDNCEEQTSELNNDHINNVDNSYTTKASVESESNVQILFTSPDKQKVAETFSEPKPNGPPEKTDQIAHAMNAAGITTTAEPETDNRTALVNMLSQKILQGTVNASQNATNTYAKTTSINTMSLQQALAHLLPPPLNQTKSTDNNQQGQNAQITPQVLHILQGKNASGNQITLVDNTQQSIINTQNSTPVLHIVQNKVPPAGTVSNGTPQQNTFSGLSLVDTGLQQGGNQLLHIVNTGNQKNNNATGQLLKRVNLLTNLANVQGANDQKMVQFVCKSADGKAIQLNAPHQRSMVLRLQPIETPKPVESQDSTPSNAVNSSPNTDSTTASQEIKSRSVYEENYAKFIQNSAGKPPILEKSTSLPKFNQAFGKPVFQDGSQKQNEINGSLTPGPTNGESAECQPTDNAINLEHIRQIGSPPLLLRKPPALASQTQGNLVQQIKQTIAPMNIQTMHGGVIYTRQIPVNIGGGQTINLITVPSTELIDDSGQKQQSDVKIFNQGDIEPSIIKIVPQGQPVNGEGSQDESNNHINVSTDNAQNPQPLLTQMRIKLPMLTKAPQMVSGARVVRPSFFQIQRNVITGANQPVYQQLVLTAAPPLGQQTIRLPQAQTRQIKVPTDGQSSSESQMSTSTLEQLREFDMVLEQVKERSTVQPNTNPNATFKLNAPSTDTSNSSVSSAPTETTQQVLYSIGTSQPLNVAYVNRKTIVTTPTTSTFVRSSDTSSVRSSATTSNHVQLPRTRSSESSSNGTPSHSRAAKVGSKPKTRQRASSNPTMKLSTVPPKTIQKPQEDEQTTQRILYILAEYKEQVENSPDKDKPAPRRRSNPPLNPSGSSKRRKSSRRSGGRDLSPSGDDSCRTMGSEDSSCGTSQGDCTENCLEPNSPQDSPRKVVRKLAFDQEPAISQPRPQPPRNVIVADGQTITVARGTAGKPATAVLMPANYILPVSMVKGGQQIAIVTNRGPKLLTVGGGEGGATNALLLQRLIGPAGLKPVLTRPGVRHVRLPTTAIHNLQAFNLTTAATVQSPNASSPAPAPTPTPPDLVESRAERSPWTDRDSDNAKPDRGSSPEGSEPWNLPSSADPHDYHYEETVQTDTMNRTVLVVQKKDGTSHRHHRLTHVSAAALRHKYAILEHELRLQKSLSEECEDLGVDSPSASELFPEAELLFSSSPAHEHTQDHPHHSHTPQPVLNQVAVHADIDDQIATDELLPREGIPDDRQELDVNLGLEDVGIVTVSEDGMQTTITLDQEEFARAHPNTTFHSEPTEEGEVQPYTITGLKSRHITSTIFHSNRAPATVLMTAPQATVISQATGESGPQSAVKYNLNMINSMPTHTHSNNINLSSVLVKDDGLTRFDSILTDSRELHLSNTASAVIHSSGNATQVIRRVCYEDDKRARDTRFLIDEPDGIIAGDDAKMVAEDSSRDATLDSMTGDVHDGNSSPERHAELYWESNSASERSEGRRPMDFSSDSEKCCKSPSFDETNSTDSSGVGTHMRLDSVIKEARGIGRSASADGSSADDTHPPLRTYPPKRLYHPLERAMERSLSGKTRAGERSPDSLEVRRRASGRGVVKRGCHCCNGSPVPPRPKKPRQRKPATDFTNI